MANERFKTTEIQIQNTYKLYVDNEKLTGEIMGIYKTENMSLKAKTNKQQRSN